jgi:hypothetical protein
MPELTQADMADYQVTSYAGRDKMDVRIIRAAYVTSDDKLPNMLAFKDHRHRVVAIISVTSVLAVERQDAAEEEMPKAIAEGFRTTTQVMEQLAADRAVIEAGRMSPGQFAEQVRGSSE